MCRMIAASGVLLALLILKIVKWQYFFIKVFKMKIFLNTILFLVFFQMLNAQNETERAVVIFHPNEFIWTSLASAAGKTIGRTTNFETVPLENTEPFLAYSIVWYSANWNENIRIAAVFTSKNEELHVQPVSLETHAERKGNRYVSELYFLENDAQQFRLQFAGTANIDSVEVHFYNPGFSEPALPESLNSSIDSNHLPSDRSACTCPQPAFLNRSAWCPNGDCPPNPNPTPTNVGHLIVHHSAGSNTSSNWAAVVRAIWDFHVNVNGWADIGYNWLVDPNGILYEGRGDNVVGAHFCGTNGATMGVCVMGDFTDVTPTSGAILKLEELLAWKCCDRDLDPLGSGIHPSSGLMLNRISGHRDGCSTSCPGDSFYPLLPDIRQSVSNFIENGCEILPLNAPTQLAATLIAPDDVELTWQDNATNESAYVLERSKSFNTNYQVVATLPANSIGFTDLGLEPQTGYFYRVKAITGSISSGYSNEVFIATGATAAGEKALGRKNVVISPNPADRLVSVSVENEWAGELAVSVFDAGGRQVNATRIFDKNTAKLKFEVNLEGYPAGVFWLKIEQRGEVGFFKILKK